jgi:hypothetical protein
LTWQRHRTKHSRNCDQCPPRHPAIWILHQRGVPSIFLCIAHAERMAKTYELERPPRI